MYKQTALVEALRDESDKTTLCDRIADDELSAWDFSADPGIPEVNAKKRDERVQKLNAEKNSTKKDEESVRIGNDLSTIHTEELEYPKCPSVSKSLDFTTTAGLENCPEFDKLPVLANVYLRESVKLPNKLQISDYYKIQDWSKNTDFARIRNITIVHNKDNKTIQNNIEKMLAKNRKKYMRLNLTYNDHHLQAISKEESKGYRSVSVAFPPVNNSKFPLFIKGSSKLIT